MDSSSVGISGFAYKAVTGGVAGAFRGATLGQNTDIDILSAPEDVWSGSALGVLNGIDHKFVQLPQSAVSMEVVSSSANDIAAGTGVQTISVVYLDAARVQKTITITMNGTTPVPMPEDVLRINTLRGVTCGTFGGANVGNISIRATGGLGATYSYMAAGVGFARSSLISIPTGMVFDIFDTVVAVNKVGGGNTWVLWNLCMQSAAGMRTKPLQLTAWAGNVDRHNTNGGFPIVTSGAGSDVWIRCEQVSTDDMNITAGFIGVLRSASIT